VGGPQWTREDFLLPGIDLAEVKLEKDAFAAVFGGRHPGRLAVAGEFDETAHKIVDAVHLVETGEPEDRVDLLHLIDRDDTIDALVQFRSALHLGDHEAAGVLLLREQGRLLEVAPFGN